MRHRSDSSNICGYIESIFGYLRKNIIISFLITIVLLWACINYSYNSNLSLVSQTPVEHINVANAVDIRPFKKKKKSESGTLIHENIRSKFETIQINNKNNDDKNNDNNDNKNNDNDNDNNNNKKNNDNNDNNNDNDDNDNNNDNNSNEVLSIPEKVKKAKKIGITYGQNCCTSAKQRFCETGFSQGNINECYAYDASVLDANFSSTNAHILNQGRGAGYWLWKPYIILKHLTDPNTPDGSYIIYSDAGAKYVGDVKYVLEFMEENENIYKGVLFFGVGLDQKYFCKRDAFILLDCDREECYNAMQINAFSGFFRKSNYSRKVIREWLNACTNSKILTDEANTLGSNLPGFRDHRHDQAVITLVMLKNGWKYDTTNGPILDKVFHHDRFKG